MKEDYYITLLEKQLSGNISVADERALADWRSMDPANEKMAKAIEMAWALTAPQTVSNTDDAELDEAFAALEARIDATPAPAKRVQLSTRRSWRTWSIAAAILLLVSAAWWVFSSDNTTATDPSYVTVTTTDSPRSIVLADGTNVELNRNSELVYADVLVDGKRPVTLIGEAYFDVQRDEEHPFIITAGNSEVRVLGTSFNVAARPANGQTQVYVISGKVALKANATGEEVVLEKSNSAVADWEAGTITTMTSGNENAVAWHTGRLVFRNVKLADALAQIAEQTGVLINLSQSAAANCLIDTRFDKTQPEDFLADLEALLNVNTRFEKGDGGYAISGGGC